MLKFAVDALFIESIRVCRIGEKHIQRKNFEVMAARRRSARGQASGVDSYCGELRGRSAPEYRSVVPETNGFCRIVNSGCGTTYSSQISGSISENCGFALIATGLEQRRLALTKITYLSAIRKEAEHYMKGCRRMVRIRNSQFTRSVPRICKEEW